MGAKLKVRQPLAKVEVVLADRTHQPLARRARRADCRGTERQAGRVHREGRSVHHLHRAARPEAARPAAGQAAAGAARRRWPRPTPAALLADWKPTSQVTLELPERPGRARRRRLASSPASQAGLGRGPGTLAASWCCRPRSTELLAGGARPRAGARHPDRRKEMNLRVHRPDRGRAGRPKTPSCARRPTQFVDYIEAKRWPCGWASSRLRASSRSSSRSAAQRSLSQPCAVVTA